MSVFSLSAKGDAEGVARLLEREPAAAKLTNKQGQTALIAAADAGEEEVVALLLKGSDVNARDKQGATALHCALASGFENIALMLIEAKADVNAADANGLTGAHLAARAKLHGVLRALVKRKAKLEAVEAGEGLTPLLIAAKNLDQEAADILLQAGAHSADKDAEGNTAVHLAVKAADPEFVNWLLERGFPVDAQNADGQTALHIAHALFKSNAGAFARALKQHGASESITDAQGLTPGQAAESSASDDQEAKASSDGAQKRASKRAAPAELDEETTKWLEEKGFSHLSAHFSKKRLGLSEIRQMDKEDLKRIGVPIKEREALLEAIEALNLVPESPEEQQLLDQEKRQSQLYIGGGILFFFIVLYFLFDWVIHRRKQTLGNLDD